MNQPLSSRLRFPVLALAVSFLFPWAARTQAADIGGTISTTLTVMEDSELTGDVTCAVPLTMPGPNPCIAFGADHIKLRLNGHTITGPITPPMGCSVPSDSMFGVGIAAIGRTDVQIQGPGVIQHFHRWGILVGLTGHPTEEGHGLPQLLEWHANPQHLGQHLRGKRLCQRCGRVQRSILRRNLTGRQQPQPSSVEHILWKRCSYFQVFSLRPQQQQFRPGTPRREPGQPDREQ